MSFTDGVGRKTAGGGATEGRRGTILTGMIIASRSDGRKRRKSGRSIPCSGTVLFAVENEYVEALKMQRGMLYISQYEGAGGRLISWRLDFGFIAATSR